MKHTKDSKEDYDRSVKRQIAIVFLLSVLASSVLVFFAVASRTEQIILEQEAKQRAEEAKESAESETDPEASEF